MQFLSYEIDTAKLATQAEVLELLWENDETYAGLSQIGNRYHAAFGNELIWHYPISEGVHTGLYIICVQEGFLSIPYDIVDAVAYEILELSKAALLDEEALSYLNSNWMPFSDDLLAALCAMEQVMRGREQ